MPLVSHASRMFNEDAIGHIQEPFVPKEQDISLANVLDDTSLVLVSAAIACHFDNIF